MKSKLAIFSFFAGSGFLDLGFEKAGFDIVHVNEISEPFIQAYKYARGVLNIAPPKFGYYHGSIDNYLNDTRLMDFLNFHMKLLKSEHTITGFIGGPPCPDFSVGGKNKGRHGDNGKLSLSYINTIIKYTPDFFIFENVKGLWRTSKHRAFYEELRETLINAGYVLTDRLVNSLEYGVAQDRNRIILFGVKKELMAGELLTTTLLESKFDWLSNLKYPGKSWREYNWPSAGETANKNGIPEELTVQHWFDRNLVLNHPNTSHYFTPRAALEKFKTILEGDSSRKSFKRLHRYRYSPTAAYGNNEVHIHPTEPRRISAAEALAIQSLPSEFALPPGMTLSNMFKTIGNGVPYLLAEGVAKTVRDFFEAIHNEIYRK